MIREYPAVGQDGARDLSSAATDSMRWKSYYTQVEGMMWKVAIDVPSIEVGDAFVRGFKAGRSILRELRRRGL